MAAERPEKDTVRGIWVSEVRRADDSVPPEPVPLYFTLPGAEGRDIQALVDAGVINLTETGAIADAELLRIVAVEHSLNAVVTLQRAFPGLKILQQTLADLLHSASLVAWPQGDHRRFFRAQVFNLDLNAPLEATIESDQLAFPILALIRKIAMLHAVPPQVNWTLCLTLHGELEWDRTCEELAFQFLAENFEADEKFSGTAKTILGEELHRAITQQSKGIALCERSPTDQQRFLNVLVPKRIAFDAHREGWCVDTVENLRYGGIKRRAPMVTWVLRFKWDARASTQPQAVYRDSVGRSLLRLGCIDAVGKLSHEF